MGFTAAEKALSTPDAMQLENLILQGKVLEAQLAHVRFQLQVYVEECERRYETAGWTLDLPKRIWTAPVVFSIQEGA